MAKNWKIHDIAQSNCGEYITVFVMDVKGKHPDNPEMDDGKLYKAIVPIEDKDFEHPDFPRPLEDRVKEELKKAVKIADGRKPKEDKVHGALADLSFLDA